jgi:hypothetical protein
MLNEAALSPPRSLERSCRLRHLMLYICIVGQDWSGRPRCPMLWQKGRSRRLRLLEHLQVM